MIRLLLLVLLPLLPALGKEEWVAVRVERAGYWNYDCTFHVVTGQPLELVGRRVRMQGIGASRHDAGPGEWTTRQWIGTLRQLPRDNGVESRHASLGACYLAQPIPIGYDARLAASRDMFAARDRIDAERTAHFYIVDTDDAGTIYIQSTHPMWLYVQVPAPE